MQSITHDHPLRSAEWIWPEAYMDLHNHYAQFRWDFDLSTIAGTIPFFITADKSYRLFVNGAYVCRGPARGYQSHWPFDEVDLATYLKPGHNWISVEAYQTGCSTFAYLHEAYAGLLVATGDPVLGEAMGASKPSMRRAPGHRRQTARLSVQLDYQEHLDLRLDDRSWITAPTPPVGWSPAIFPPNGHFVHSLPFGRHPYDSVEPRGIPMLREEWLIPQLPTAQAIGGSADGYEAIDNVSWHWVEEAPAVDQWRSADDLGAMRADDGLSLTIPVTGAGNFHAVAIPPGEYTFGVVEVMVDGALGGEILDFHYDQFYRDGRPQFLRPGEGCNVALGNRLILRAGRNEHTFYHPLGFGAMVLIARDLSTPLTVRLRIRTSGYPFAFRGAFESSDEALNTIYAACRRTQQLCAIDAYVDTPWREQAQWWGDARVQARNTFYLDGDARLLRRGIRSIAGQSVYGLTPGHAPTSAYWCVLPDFALTWILTIWDYYWQTGEIDLFLEQRARIDEVLAYFDTPEARDPSGLLRYDSRVWLFEDWSTLPTHDMPAFLNLWYVLALRRVAAMCDIAGLGEDASKFAGLGTEHTERIVSRFVDPVSGFVRPTVNAAGVVEGEPSVHDQTLAIMLDIGKSAHDAMLDKMLLPYLRQETLAGAVPSAFWSTYVLELAIERGYADVAVDFIRSRWTPMMGTGTTWEGFEWKETSGWSACHAWTGHPSFHFVNALAGISQTAAGWTEVLIRPTFVDGIDYVSACVPSPQGDIVSEWRRTDGKVTGRVDLPAGVKATLALPGRDLVAISGQATYEV